ncbi:MAG: hypothetical protein LBI34_00490 [Puniceicoccales bacterium]|nr:hypothetical protein [Puniceicoccales bacterium]
MSTSGVNNGGADTVPTVQVQTAPIKWSTASEAVVAFRNNGITAQELLIATQTGKIDVADLPVGVRARILAVSIALGAIKVAALVASAIAAATSAVVDVAKKAIGRRPSGPPRGQSAWFRAMRAKLETVSGFAPTPKDTTPKIVTPARHAVPTQFGRSGAFVRELPADVRVVHDASEETPANETPAADPEAVAAAKADADAEIARQDAETKAAGLRVQLQALQEKAFSLCTAGPSKAGVEDLQNLARGVEQLANEGSGSKVNELTDAVAELEKAIADFNNPVLGAIRELQVQVTRARVAIAGIEDSSSAAALGELLVEAGHVIARNGDDTTISAIAALAGQIQVATRELSDSPAQALALLQKNIEAADAFLRANGALPGAGDLKTRVTAAKNLSQNQDAEIAGITAVNKGLTALLEPLFTRRNNAIQGLRSEVERATALLAAAEELGVDITALKGVHKQAVSLLNLDLQEVSVSGAELLKKGLSDAFEQADVAVATAKSVVVLIGDLRARVEDASELRTEYRQLCGDIEKLNGTDVFNTNEFESLETAVEILTEDAPPPLNQLQACLKDMTSSLQAWKEKIEELKSQLSALNGQVEELERELQEKLSVHKNISKLAGLLPLVARVDSMDGEWDARSAATSERLTRISEDREHIGNASVHIGADNRKVDCLTVVLSDLHKKIGVDGRFVAGVVLKLNTDYISELEEVSIADKIDALRRAYVQEEPAASELEESAEDESPAWTQSSPHNEELSLPEKTAIDGRFFSEAIAICEELPKLGDCEDNDSFLCSAADGDFV